MELDGWLVGAPEIGWKKNPQNGREVNPGFHPCPQSFTTKPENHHINEQHNWRKSH
jgi:hypothetical protein